MPEPTQSFRLNSRTAVWLGCILIAFLVTHSPPPEIEAPPPINDKVMHFVGLAGLGILTVWRMASDRRRPGLPLVVLWYLGLVCYGAMDELTQPWVGRHCEFLDWVADSLGALAGMSLGALFFFRRPR